MKRVNLPVATRDPRRIARRLEPVRSGNLYVIELCRGLECRVCAYPEKPRITIKRRPVRDPLSSLTMRLPVVEARVCGRTAWRAEWRRGMLVVENVWCPAIVEDECVRVDDTCVPLGEASRVLGEKCGVSDAGRGHSRPRPR